MIDNSQELPPLATLPLPPSMDILSHGGIAIGLVVLAICLAILFDLYHQRRSCCDVLDGIDVELGDMRAQTSQSPPAMPGAASPRAPAPTPRRTAEKPRPPAAEGFIGLEIDGDGAREGGREYLDECVICLDGFERGVAAGARQQPVALRCRHVHHASCIAEWLLRSDHRCLMCRENMILHARPLRRRRS